MAETFETLKTRLGEWLGVDIVRLPDASRGDCFNLVQRRVLRKHDLRFGEVVDTLALVANTPTYSLPTGYRSPLTFWYTNPVTDSTVILRRITKDEFDLFHPDSTEGGVPTVYTIWNNLFYVGPTPNQSITLNRNYYKFLDDLADGSPTNTNDFVTQAWDVLFFGALEEATKNILEDVRAPIWAERFRELESDLVGEHQREKTAGRVAQSMEPG